MGICRSTVLLKNVTVINIARSRTLSRVSIGFSCTVSKMQNTGHSQRISPSEVVRARFHKKTQRLYICMKSCVDSSFDRFFVHYLRNLKYWPFPMY
ncbi:hypothetical protein BHM03_00056320 [Ensete ventricosum]|nr:hypothetical protein BHM03_00056320 [Ensete ventricosum]